MAENNNKKKYKSNRKNLLKNKYAFGGLIYVGLIVVCLIAVYVIPSVHGMFTRTYITEQTEMEISDEVEGYLVRDEVVYTSVKAGKINRLGDEGKLIKADTGVVEISGAGLESSKTEFLTLLDHLGDGVVPTDNGVSKDAGYVCYTVDGAENILSPALINKTKRETFEEAGSYSSAKVAKGECAQGDPVFKIVRTGRWYLVCYLDNDAAKKYADKSNITVRFNDNELKARIENITTGKNTSKLVLSCGVAYDGYLTDRKLDVELVAVSAKGLLIKDKSIVEKDGKQGVIVKNKIGKYYFKEICIKADNGETCVVYQDLFMDENSNFVETIGIYDEIIESPSKEDIEKAE